MANPITCIRIVCSLALLFCAALSSTFWWLYVVAGLSDVADGWVARRTNTASEFGAKLDTVADGVFVVVCLVKLMPVFDIPPWLYVWVALIAAIKIVNIVSGYVVQRRFVAVHSVMNKVVGVLLFLLPLTFSFINIRYSAAVVCSFATFAAIQEGHFIRTKKQV
ncbi:MAG: CDP-alcohol phosphatidyltransferase family protein [Bacteroidaceae bacterium]|nr:CDP-alcohol phosphatidyltransferase family protein [Bacteroidaceae bacterium]MBR5962592.1 CDP-alcohol phosphatidyltransferase family protein [Bacteroidaceae bacterium]